MGGAPVVTDDVFARLAAFVAARMDVRDQLDGLPTYRPVMGHRYALRGRTEPLSVFQGEGLALYLFVKAFRPRVVLDLFTGTGYAAAHLAAGHQFTKVYSVDNYSEGGDGVDADDTTRLRLTGWQGACDLIQACDLRNVKLIFGSHRQLIEALDADGVVRGDIDLLFLDGAAKTVSEEIFDHPGAAVITHDEPFALGPNDFRITGGSHLTFSVPPVMLPTCHAIFAPYFQLEVGDAIAWRPTLQETARG